MRREAEGGRSADTQEGDGSDLLTQMIQILLRGADMPPREVEGVSEEFCDSKTVGQQILVSGSDYSSPPV